ncbi:hypothetical protein NUM3379_28490 [Kineococcus sp. NUM-3379]
MNGISELISYPFRAVKRELAGVAAGTVAPAGWQALDLSRPKRCWEQHRRARGLAQASEDAGVVTYVTA